MAKSKKTGLFSLFVLVFGFYGAATQQASAACSNLTASFSYSKSKTCGVPVVISLTNTSTGSSQNVATYSWYVGTTLLKKGVGKSGTSYTITNPGTYVFKLIALDTGKTACKDSTTQTVVIAANAPRIKDGNGIFTYSPVWENCISNIGVPDTFGLTLEVQDTLKNYTIIWGDGTGNATGSQLLKTQKIYHKYNNLGQFQVKIIAGSGSCKDTLTGVVANERNPVAGLVGPPTGTNSGCIPLTVRFVNNSSKSSPSTTFTWDFGNGDTRILPSSTYRDTLYYTYKRFKCNGVVKLTMSNTCGTSDATWNPINASSKDSAIIKPLNPANCDLTKDFQFDNGSEVRFCNIPNPRKFYWDFGDGTNSGWITSSTATQLKKYSKRGSYVIKLIDSNTCGKDTGYFTLKIDSLPKLSATANPTKGCPPLVVSFKETSTGASTRSWDFGDGSNASNLSNVNHTYNTGGAYKAILSISNNCGTLKDTFDINVRKKVKASFPFIADGCAPVTVNFNNQSVQGDFTSITYKWDFGDGTSSTQKNPSHTWGTIGPYTVTLIATDSCGSDTFKRSFYAYGKPTGNITINNNACQGAPVSFSFTNTPVNWVKVLWGDGQVSNQWGYTTSVVTLSHTYDSAKTHTLRFVLFGSSGCFDTLNKPVVVSPRPVIDFTPNSFTGCTPFNATFTNNSQDKSGGNVNTMNFIWSYGNGTKSYGKDSLARFVNPAKFDSVFKIKLVGTNQAGCMDSVQKNIRIYPKPLSKFTLSNTAGCAPLNVTTSNFSQPFDTGSISIMSFIWDFGNGRKAYRSDTSARFLASKTQDTTYNISLIALSEHGCRDTSYSSVKVYPKPKSSFTRSVTAGCKPLSVNFTNTSTPFDTGSISIMAFNWKFGNSISTNTTHPTTVYDDILNKDTVYTISLEATSEHGCKDTSFATVRLHPDPLVKFNMSRNNGCGPLLVNFTNNTVNATKYSWQFGDYGLDSVANPSKVFFGRDIFDSVVVVKLSAVSAFGCLSDTLTEKVTVFGVPIANYLISTDTFCFPDQMQFLNQSLAAYNYKWDLGDGTVTTTTNPVHFFKKSSNPFKDTTYNINLVATSPYGCRDTARGTMTVLPYPIPNFSVDNPAGCAPHTVQFTNKSVNSLRYFWVFGDGYTSTQVNPTHTFINTGLGDTSYQVVLYTYSLDCIDSMSIWIPVYKESFSFFRTDRVDPCDAGYFQFTDFSENAPSVKYNFGDGVTSTQNHPLHLFPTSPYQDTSFTVQLYTSSARGCNDTFQRVVTLPQRLSIGMRDTNYALCAPAVIQFKNYSQGAKTYIWDFGDNGGSSKRDPIYEYQKPGLYQYRLYAYDANGCMDSVVSVGRVRVDLSPTADYDYSPGKGRMPNENRIFFTDKSRSAIPLNYKWDFSDPAGIPATANTPNATHDFSDSGYFKVCLMVDNGGCADTFCNLIRIEPAFPTPDFTVDKDSGCPPLTVQFTNLSVNADRYIWFFGDGERSEDKDPVHTYRYSGYYDVTLVAMGPGGEGKTVKYKFIKVLNKPFTYFDLTPSTLYLPNAIFTTRNLSTGAVGYNWTVYNSQTGNPVGTSVRENDYFRVHDTGYYDVELISVSNQGCRDTLFMPKPVFVNPKGVIYVPDAFTPTRDDRNELFKPNALNIQNENYKFLIYNRWGQIVYETTDPAQGWDGTFQDKICPAGVYAYKVNARLFNGDDVTNEGVVHLLR